MHEGKDKEQLEEVYRLQAQAEKRERSTAAAEVERAAERSNPMPQKAPGEWLRSVLRDCQRLP